ncbi:hypothetical protein PPTG_24677 [Phytophthora nicotianae INRA-310]|uniref:Uncharacterized protein n=1 Tax=Phytophthora nicotianae (strain INRA-310) TaxID=761204 RepID=W2PC87_PHYN3|nr:hypothetical protein PPTG_24677 [Phytophthora nicotianae INRA-310]ETM98260.1 hypothetical protein PPTG_24677 [Phytophthora nicotianae INRA-310]
MTCGIVAAALDKQLPALGMLVRSAQPTVSPVEKPSTDSREAKEELSRD